MYKLQSVKIDQFWHRFDAGCEFRPDVNVIIGKNGTGKTTFMNILSAVLSVDMNAIASNDFESVVVSLSDGKKKRTIKATKIDDDRSPFLVVEYQISRKKYLMRFVSTDDRRMAMHYRRRAQEESSEVRKVLSGLVSLSSLSVYRLRSSDDYEVRDRNGTRLVAPVDYRLNELMQRLTHYQLELSQRARSVSTKLQKDVLASILYGEEDSRGAGYQFDFDKEAEKRKLVSAYSQLNAIDSGVRKKINFHVDAIDEAISALAELREGRSKERETGKKVDFRSLEALRKSRKIIEMSLDAETEITRIFSQINKFLSIARTFIEEKQFDFEGGNLTVSTKQGGIELRDLSSGEKQLLILLTEALLQKETPCIFLADEPELSLHIEWQRMIIPAIMELNPNAQVIAATHSPEVASKFSDSIFDMEDLINGEA
ncbi:MAG: AAA family ATPase [Pseudomonadota bacterium]|uniref:AAA family ATPase n=2 Tax=Alloalcanivorax venustensis TaxID=172371 RepID=UPI002EC81EFB|nr:AAA family ATPase [Pseudomonadota bacterium]